MDTTMLKSDPQKNYGSWLQVFWIIPVLFIVMVFAGLIAGMAKVNSHDYFSLGLTRIGVSALVEQVNASIFLGLRLLIPMIFISACFIIYHKNLSKAVISTFGTGLLWMLMLIGVFAFIKHETAGVDLHRVPDFVSQTLTLGGFFERHFVDKIEVSRMVLMPIKQTFVLLAALTIALPFGVFFEKFVKLRFLTNRVKKAGKFGVVLFWAGFAASMVAATVLNAADYAFARTGQAPQPNIILISIDTLRQDALGVYGGKDVKTPNLDKFAKEGAVFENAYSNSPWTLPSHATMFTGFTPTHLGIRKVEDRLGKNALTLPEVLNNYGYITAAVTSYILVSPSYGFDQGFDRFIYNRDLKADQIAQAASAFIKINKDKKFFLFLHLYDPHWPYHPPLEIAREFFSEEPTQDMYDLLRTQNYYDWVVKAIKGSDELVSFSRKMYDAEVSYVDMALGKVFAALAQEGIEGRTVVIVTSDHGEEFKEHGLMGHGLTLYDEALKIPFIVRFPALIPNETRIKMPVQLIDIFPTVLAMAGIESPIAHIEGKDLTSEVYLRGKEESREILAETAMSGEMRYAVFEKGFKYITPFELTFGETLISHDTELFDLNQDPGELANLAEDMPTMTNHFKELLAKSLTNIERAQKDHGLLNSGESKELSSEEIERLRSLGYIQ